MDIGTTLRTARERKGLTLAQIAATTKIPVHNLRALEENAFEHVPRGIFVRGFLRAYATEVGLDPHAVVEQFLAEYGEPAPAAADAAAADAPPMDDAIQWSPVDPDLTPSGPGWGYALVVAALVIAIVTVHRSNTASTAASAGGPDAVVASGSAVRGDLAPVATSGQDVPQVLTAATSTPSALRFDLQAQGECWVEAIVDGRRVVYRLMQPGERATIESGGEIVLRVGDPGAVTYSVNGTPGKPLGRAGIPVTVRFTNQGA